MACRYARPIGSYWATTRNVAQACAHPCRREISEHQSDVEKIARAFSVTPKILLDTDQAKIGCKHVALEGFVVGNGALAELSADDIIQASHLPIHHVEEIGISGKKG